MAGFSRTWWGQRFLTALERFTDPGRLGRGRTYARNGKVTSYHLEGSKVEARVRGSINPYFGVYKEPLYTTTIEMNPIPITDWHRVIADVSTKASFVTRLLMNEMPERIDEAFSELGLHLLPHDQRDFANFCSCPDWGNPCKHIAGVYYLLAEDLDSDPFLLFELRGFSRENLRNRLAESSLGKILSAELEPREIEIEAVTSYHTIPRRESAPPIQYREFWQGARRLPELELSRPPSVPALSIRQQGDYPAFWPKDASFITTMEELYERVRTKSTELS